MKLNNSSFVVFLLVCFCLFGELRKECSGLNLFLSPQQAQAFVADVKGKTTADDDSLALTEEIGVPVRPGEVEKEIQEEFIEDNSDPQEAALETEERTREKTEL